ncbi:CIC11C00000003854 [Sungouiella intermedia]|uniref:DNA-binding protein RAP1 n=1 Tax=Sungouiella intermedia TaxID=45354 RepID=A0A1L0GD87_9ASCO|nr:CIC11C00000004463 [[Candida] intermedia]SGZ54277.1 CIC11C00000003854 [[Candida] intermedia]
MTEPNQVLQPPGVLLSTFTDATGQPVVFYIDPMDPNREKYQKLIHTHGGVVETDERMLQRNDVAQLSTYPWPDRTTIAFSFIDQLLKKGLMVYIDDYRLDAALAKKGPLHYDDNLDAANAVAQALAKKLKMGKTTKKFDAESDAYILEQVRMKPRFRTSHKFFEELAHHSLLEGHTGNSVRSRFRAHLEHKLQYVFKTDDFDNLILDEEGNRIAIPVNLAKTIKNRFSADDDFHLCDDIINHVLNTQDPDLLKFADGQYKDGYLNENKFSVLISFFDDYARHNPQHSSLSWRDRYRKFARVYGLQKYRDYYLRELKSKDGPQPMKNLTSRALKEKKKIENNVRRMKKAHDDAEVAAAAAVAAVANNGHLLGHPDHVLQLPHTQMDANAAAAVANLAVSAREASALDEEIGEVKNSNIHEALRNVGAEAGRVNIDDDIVHSGVRALADHSAIHPSLSGNPEDSDGDDFELAMKLEEESQDSLNGDAVYMPRNTTIDDMFNKHFYMNDSKDILDMVGEILRPLGPTDIDTVFKEFERLGLSRAFTAHILKVTSANAKSIHDFLVQLFQGFDKLLNPQNMLEHKQMNLADLLFPRNQNGFWIQEYDLYLRKGKYQKLQFQDEESLRERRAFLGLDE